LHQQGCRIRSTVVHYAADSGNLRLLKYYHEQGFIFKNCSFELVVDAAHQGHLECLKFLHEQGECRIIFNTVCVSTYNINNISKNWRKNRIECFEYCYTNLHNKDPVYKNWNEKINHVIPHIDLTKPMYRHLFSMHFLHNPQLQQAINKAKTRLQKQQKCVQVLAPNLCQDVIECCVVPYF
jgi:hypothetical protein